MLFGLSVWTIHQNFHHYNAQNFWNSLSAVPASNILWAIALMSLNYVIMTGYDYLAVNYVGNSLPYSKTALVGFICSGISHSVGFALLSSCMIRYRFYATWGLPVIVIAQISAFCDLTFCLGLFVVGAIIFLKEPLAVPNLLDLPFNSVQPLGVIFLLVILAYLLVTVVRQKPFSFGKWTLPHLSVKLALGQLIVAALDWSLAAAVFYAILSPSVPLSYPAFFSIYILAQVAGLASNVPGGLGVFETVMIVLLSQFISSEELLGSLLIYRGVYYFIPLTVSVLLLGKYELGRFLNTNRSWRKIEQQ
ncbi:MAG: lysylphosphatidylglycerol synthase domain-containing protein [Cyanobacteria bacterium P01_G01_bin.49]